MGRRLESEFVQDVLKPRLEYEFPGCVIIKQDPNTSFQGVPDHLVLYGNRWALLETKRARTSAKQMNQDYYVRKFGDMAYSAFVHPENLEEVIDALRTAFGSA